MRAALTARGGKNFELGPLASGTNPNNRKRHRQADTKGGTNRQGKCGKQIYPSAHVVYRHVASSKARINREAATETNAVTGSSSRLHKSRR
jgi:hypothetical protein